MSFRDVLQNNLPVDFNLHNFVLDDNFYSLIDRYILMIKKWGVSHNIVSGKYAEMDMILAAYDSLVGGSFLSLPSRIYDAGSGGGFPGMVLAMASPSTEVILVEANRKKCSFLRMVKAQLGLTQVTIANERIEKMPKVSFIITKAAFSPPNIAMVTKALEPAGKLAIWATPKNQANFLAGLSGTGMKLLARYAYEVPDMGERMLLLLQQDQ